jgi:hypothetical protein
VDWASGYGKRWGESGLGFRVSGLGDSALQEIVIVTAEAQRNAEDSSTQRHRDTEGHREGITFLCGPLCLCVSTRKRLSGHRGLPLHGFSLLVVPPVGMYDCVEKYGSLWFANGRFLANEDVARG